MTHSTLCRLAYLVTPKPELSRTLGLDEGAGHEICHPTAVITPVRDYEEAFESWKRAWMAKAKQDFVSEFARTWLDEFPDFTARLQPTESFDRWWNMSEIDVIETDSAWKPS